MKDIAEAVASGVLPGRVWIYTNYDCNLACRYCLTQSSPTAPRRSLSRKRVLEIAHEAKDLGFTALGVTGGEPFLLRWMPEAVADLADLLPTVVNTNGALFTPRVLERMEVLADRDAAVQLSLDHPDPERNDALRAPDDHWRVQKAARALHAIGVRVRIATTADTLQGEALERLKSLVADLGVAEEDHVVRPVVRRGRAALESLGVPVTEADLPPELTITATGAYRSAFGPTVRNGRMDTDLLLTRTTRPLATPAALLLRLVTGMPRGQDARQGIR
ncbi:MAG: radical SAM protein [Deltaproteobacteria bacterium]|nr:radical SAM protein [Deltaproteobacteria bacterium]